MWPRVADGVRAALVVAARHGLPGVDDVPVELLTDDPETVAAGAGFDGLAGFLATAIDDGVVEADGELRSHLQAVWRQALVGTVRVEAHAVGVAALLDRGGVRWRLTKGAATAHLDYPDQLSARTFGDVDVMVHPEDWVRALDVLASVGYDRPAPELRRGFDVRFGKGATLVDDRELEVDLHLRFAIGRFGVRARMGELFARCDRLVLGGRQLLTLDGPDRLLHACHHLALGGFSGLRVARDVAQLLLVSEVDWERTVSTAQRWGVGAVVAQGITGSWGRLELDVVHPAKDWALDETIGSGDRKVLELFASDRPFREQALTALSVLPVHRIPPYLVALALPSQSARTRGALSGVTHVRSRVRSLLRTRALERS